MDVISIFFLSLQLSGSFLASHASEAARLGFRSEICSMLRPIQCWLSHGVYKKPSGILFLQKFIAFCALKYIVPLILV